MMRKFVAYFLGFCLLLSLPPNAHAMATAPEKVEDMVSMVQESTSRDNPSSEPGLSAASNMRIAAKNVTAEAGSPVEVEVTISNNPGIVGGELVIAYDEKLVLTNADEGKTFAALNMTKPGLLASPCKFLWDAVTFSTTDIADGTILTLFFQVSDTAISGEKLSVEIVSFDGFSYLDLENTVPVETVNGIVTVAGDAELISASSGRIDGTQARVSIVSASTYQGARFALAGYTPAGKMQYLTIRDVTLVEGENVQTIPELDSSLSYVAFLLSDNLAPLCAKIPVQSSDTAELTGAATESAIMSVERVSSLPGGTAVVNVQIMDNPGIMGATLTLTYDNSRLSLKKASSGSAFQPLSFDISGKLSSPCKFMWDGTQITKDDIKDGSILTLEFEVASDASAPDIIPVRLSCNADDVIDKQGNPIALKIFQGAVSVVDYVPGDVNGDKAVRANDVVLIRRHSLGGYDVNINTAAANVNGDSTINVSDVVLVRQYIVGGYGAVLLPSGVICVHELEEVPRLEPTERRVGNIAYWQCSICGKCFADSSGTQELPFEETILDSTGLDEDEHRIFYEIANGDPYIQKLVETNVLVAPKKNTFHEGQGLTLDSMSVDGYKFQGWFDGPDDSASKITQISAGTTRNVRLYAHWKGNEYNVYYKSSLFLKEAQATYTTRTGLNLPTPEYSGYVFTGWSDEKGKLYGTMIPPGTTGDITLTANWTSERNRTYTKPTLDEPIIYEDEQNKDILFVYEIGEMRNVPLYTIVDFGRILGDGITETVTYTSSSTISEESMKAYATSVQKATTESSSWTLSDQWNEVSSIDEEWCKEHNVTTQEGEVIAKSETNNWNISNGTSGSTDTTYADTNTKSWENQVKINSSSESSTRDMAAASINSTVKADAGFVKSEISAELGVETEVSTKNQSGMEVGGSNGNQNLHTDSTTENAAWNSSSSYGGSQTNSISKETSVAISDLINQKYHYGNSYTTGGTSEEMKGLSASTAKEESYSSAVTYRVEKTEEVTQTYTTTSAKSGYYRQVMAGTAHVFGVVGYHLATSSFYVYTYSVMDDEQHKFWDYSATSSSYNDMENGVIPFEIPYDLADYVAGLTCASEGLSIDQEKGIITGYTGTDNCVTIPEYKLLEDGKVIKITGISGNAFRNNRDIVAVVLSDYITEIPDGAFEGCSSLVGVTGGAIKKIGANAFKGCSGIAEIGIDQKIETLGERAFEGVSRLIVRASNGKVAAAAVNSGAKRIVLHMDYLKEKEYDLRDEAFTVPEGTECFEWDGVNAEYKDFSLVSNAEETLLRDVNIQSAKGIPLQIASSKTGMDNVTVSATGLAFVLSAENVRLGLQGTISVSSSQENAMLVKNLTRYNLLKDVDGYLKIRGTLLVCGTYTDDAYITYNALKKIDLEAFNALLNTYTLTFDAQGGECEVASREIPNSSKIGDLPIPTQEHYGFDGWYLSDGVTQVTPETVFSDGVSRIVYAHWNPNQCNLRFDPAGGFCNETIRTITLTVAVGTLPTASCAGYTFDGWYLTNGSRLTSETVFTEEIDQIATARWTANSYTIFYDGNGGTANMSSKSVTYGESYGTLTDASRAGYKFAGWYSSPSDGERIYASTTVATADNHTLYAHWDVIRVTIPNFNGWSVGDAENWCNNNGVGYTKSWAYDWAVPRDRIRSNSHVETTVDWGTATITLYVSSGEKEISVGDTVYVDVGTQYWSTSYGNGSYGWFSNGRTGQVVMKVDGVACPYNIDWTGWVPAGAVHQRTN